MRLLPLMLLALVLAGCASTPKRTQFYKDGKLVKTFVGRGVFDGNTWFGTYKIWTSKGWSYYEYRCDRCEVVETPLEAR